MPEQVAALFVRFAELAAAEGATPDDGSGIDGVWTTTIDATSRDRNWRVAMNCDTETEHTITDFPSKGDRTALRPASATVWLGTLPAGVCTPNDGSLIIQATIGNPSSIEAELLADIETHMAAIDEDHASTQPEATTGGDRP